MHYEEISGNRKPKTTEETSISESSMNIYIYIYTICEMCCEHKHSRNFSTDYGFLCPLPSKGNNSYN